MYVWAFVVDWYVLYRIIIHENTTLPGRKFGTYFVYFKGGPRNQNGDTLERSR